MSVAEGTPRPTWSADQIVPTVLVVVFALFVVRDAWVGDDAYITLRTVDNWVNGRGLVWNLGERVQAYTHPLWMIVITALYAFTREGYYTLLVPSFVCSLGAVVVFARKLVPAGPAGWAVLALLPLSRAFVDYSTSGLENPLTHLLLVSALAVWFLREPGLRTVMALGALLGLALVNRMDTLLLFGPLVAVATWDAWRDGATVRALAARLALGLLPFFAWEAFSLVYYGAFVPNTALAKLNTGIPRGELAVQGLFYLLDCLERDPLTALVLVAGLGSPFATRDRRATVAAAAGILYLLYVVRIGGDFMSGRFLAAPFLVAVACLARLPLPTPMAAGALATIAVLVSLGADIPTLAPVQGRPAPEFVKPNARGIADERAFYAFQGNGLESAARIVDMPGHRWRDIGERLPKSGIVIVKAAGLRGWAGARSSYLVDDLALSDPLLARLPSVYNPRWRIGHFKRAIPHGYLETIASRKDKFEDPELAALFQAVRTVTRGPIWSRARFREIWRLQTGYYHIDVDRYRYANAVEFVAGAPQDTVDNSLARPDLVELPPTGAHVDLGGPATLKWLYVRRRANDDLRILFYRDGACVGQIDMPREIPKGDWIAGDYIDVPEKAIETGYDALRIVPISGPRPWWLLSVELAPKKTMTTEFVAGGEGTLPAVMRTMFGGPRAAQGSSASPEDALIVTEDESLRPIEEPSLPLDVVEEEGPTNGKAREGESGSPRPKNGSLGETADEGGALGDPGDEGDEEDGIQP